MEAQYSHLNGLEFLEARKPLIWQEIQDVVASIDAEACKTKFSKEKTRWANYVTALKI